MPIVEPMTLSCRKNTRWSSADGAKPLVPPETTSVPPGRSARSECFHVASPTVSSTASTRSGSRAPLSNASWAPSSTARSPFAASRDVTHTRRPAWRASTVAALATPPPAPWISTVSPGCTPALTNSIR